MRNWMRDKAALPEIIAPQSPSVPTSAPTSVPTKPVTPTLPWENERVKAILGPAAYTGQTSNARGLVFAMDATGSRAVTWKLAIRVQAEMFSSLTKGLKVQLVHYRGTEFQASKWSHNPRELADQMQGVVCRSGPTQIEAVLKHTEACAHKQSVAALVFVGDCVEEKHGDLVVAAHKLAARGVKAFMFQEGDDAAVAECFRHIAAVTQGAHCTFGQDAARELADLLAAVAAFASGGTRALMQLAHRPGALLLLKQMK